VHRLVKRPIEMAITSTPVSWMTRRRVRGKRLILAYHGIIPDGETPAGETALFIPQREFARHLDALAAEADVAPLDRLDAPGDGRPRVAITFDDGYRGAVTVGVQELAARSLPATIFVAPARLNDHVFWWDALLYRGSTLNEKAREHALTQLGGIDERVRAWAFKGGFVARHNVPAYARTATHGELTAALSYPALTFGSHTWSHPNLATLGIAEILVEVSRSRDWLRKEFGKRAIDWLAYPYGLSSVQASVAAAHASYVGAVGIEGGWHRAIEVSPFARPRFSIGSGLSVAGLRARLHGAVLS